MDRRGKDTLFEAIAGDEALRLWLALRDASVAQPAEVERAARDYLGDEVDTIGRDELAGMAARIRYESRMIRARIPVHRIEDR